MGALGEEKKTKKRQLIGPVGTTLLSFFLLLCFADSLLILLPVGMYYLQYSHQSACLDGQRSQKQKQTNKTNKTYRYMEPSVFGAVC